MPLYSYCCSECGKTHDDFRTIGDRDTPGVCGCGGPAPRQFSPCGSRGMIREFGTPIEMYSVALSDPGEVRDFQRRNPGIDISSDRRDPLFGVPVVRTRQQKLSVLRNEGFVELR